jgi:hypothetical protein
MLGYRSMSRTNVGQAAAADRVQPHLLDRHHGARLGRPMSPSSPNPNSPAGRSSAIWRAAAHVFVERERKHKSGEQAGEIGRRLAPAPDGAVRRRATGDGNRCCRSRARCSARRRWRSSGRADMSTSSRWRSPIRGCTACRWAASIAARGLDRRPGDLCRTSRQLLREGASTSSCISASRSSSPKASNRKEVAARSQEQVRQMMRCATALAEAPKK